MNCQLCDAPIPAERLRRPRATKYCSSLCCKRAYAVRQGHPRDEWGIKRPRDCQVCGKTYTPRSEPSFYCSKVCGRRGSYLAERARLREARGTSTPRPCHICGADFMPKRKNSTCCSSDCYRRKSLAHLAAESAARRGPRPCDACGVVFSPPRRNDQRHCSTRCRQDDQKQRDRLRKFNLTPAEFDAMYARQGGCCAICRIPESANRRRLAIDHDHACCADDGVSCGRCVRGLLCETCNRTLGKYERFGYYPASFADYLTTSRIRSAA